MLYIIVFIFIFGVSAAAIWFSTVQENDDEKYEFCLSNATVYGCVDDPEYNCSQYESLPNCNFENYADQYGNPDPHFATEIKRACCKTCRNKF